MRNAALLREWRRFGVSLHGAQTRPLLQLSLDASVADDRVLPPWALPRLVNEDVSSAEVGGLTCVTRARPKPVALAWSERRAADRGGLFVVRDVQDTVLHRDSERGLSRGAALVLSKLPRESAESAVEMRSLVLGQADGRVVKKVSLGSVLFDSKVDLNGAVRPCSEENASAMLVDDEPRALGGRDKL